MENNAVFVVLAISFCTTILCSIEAKQYRLDYEYNRRTDSFYKLHVVSRSGWQSSKVCLAEGAALMVPASSLDLTQLHGMYKKYPDLENYVWVGLDGESHESAEMQPIIRLDSSSEDVPDLHLCDVVSREGEIKSLPCFRQLPFICKAKATDVPYDSHCDVYANGYQYNDTVGSCYKVPPIAGNWNEAYAECHAENAHLAVLNSEAEKTVVQDLLKVTPKVDGTRASWFVYLGFRAEQPVGNETAVFKTIFNQTLEEAGFAEWSPNEPNNSLGKEYCGCLFINDGKLNDLDCHHDYGFVCEKEHKAT